MATLGSLSVNVLANTAGFSSGLNAAQGAVSKFSGGISGLGSKVLGSVGPLAAATAGLVGLGSAAAGLSRGISLAADLEQLEVSFTTMTGSADKAKSLLTELRDFAASTPFQITELAPAAKSLLAFGVDAQNIIPTMQRLGDVSAGLGIPVGELSEIYGKAKVSGRLFMEDINQLTGRGIPIIGELAKQFGVAEAEVRGLVSEGKVGFDNLEQAFVSMTSSGGQFAGLMAAQSQTLSGVWSTLRDNIDASLATVGQTIIEKFNLKEVLKNVTTFVQEKLPAVLDSALAYMNPFIDWFASAASAVADGFQLWGPVATQTLSTLVAYWGMLWDGAKGFFGFIGGALSSFTGWLTGGNMSMRDFTELVITALATLEFGFKNWRAIVELAGLQVARSIVGLGNDITFIFTDVIPGVLKAGWNIFTLTFEKITELAVKFGENLWDILTFQDAEGIDFGEFAKDYASAIGEELRKVPTLADRELSQFEKTLDDMIGEKSKPLAIGLANDVAERLKALDAKPELPPVETPVAPPAPPVGPGAFSQLMGASQTFMGNLFGGIAKGIKDFDFGKPELADVGVSAASFGSSEAQSLINKAGEQDRQLALQKRQLEAEEATRKLVGDAARYLEKMVNGKKSVVVGIG